MERKLVLLSLLIVVISTLGCGPKYPKCDTDNDCTSNEKGVEEKKLFCVNGLCQQCKIDDDCGDDSYECNAGVCDPIPNYCTSVDDCPGKQKCRENRCSAECVDNSECPSGKCEGGDCVETSQCEGDADCPDGQLCKEGKCGLPVSSGGCTLESIHFDYDAASLSANARSTLQADADCIKSSHLRVRIEGHTDETGSNEYNLSLGERRARSVYKYLRQLGVSKDAMTTLTYGEEKPICFEGSSQCHSKNRRVELQIR